MIGLPPKPKFTKDEITNAALTVAREKGVGAVSAREVAVVLVTSTRPIFTYYHTMDELKKAVRLFAEDVFQKYVEKGLSMEPPFLGVGVQYLEFAQQEPELYKLLYMTRPEEGQSDALEAMGRVRARVRDRLMESCRMDAAEADRYFRDMWLTVHSLCSLTVTGSCAFSRQEVQQILTGFSLSLYKALKEVPGFTDGTFDRDEAFRSVIGDAQATFCDTNFDNLAQ